MSGPPAVINAGLDLVHRRAVLDGPIEVNFKLAPGDHPLVAAGDAIVAGTTIAERLRDARVVELGPAATAESARAGDRWMTSHQGPSRLRRGSGADAGELLYERGGRWALAAGEHAEPIESPLAGVVRDVRPGMAIRVRAQGRVLHGVEALGDPTRGQLSLGS